jgi:hypothetical protein
MKERELIEAEIRAVLAGDSAAVVLSDKLFGPGGLFGRLATTEEERRTRAQTALFKQAQQKLSDRQETEATDFSRTVSQARAWVPRGEHVLKHR